jgi:hypothetical protein
MDALDGGGTKLGTTPLGHTLQLRKLASLPFWRDEVVA